MKYNILKIIIITNWEHLLQMINMLDCSYNPSCKLIEEILLRLTLLQHKS